jgi:hypothetical protein
VRRGGGGDCRRAVVGLRAERYRVLVGKWRELGGLPPKSLGVRSVLLFTKTTVYLFEMLFEARFFCETISPPAAAAAAAAAASAAAHAFVYALPIFKHVCIVARD